MQVTILRGGRGIYTRIDPARLFISDTEGVAGLAYAVNVVVDDSYRISRRGGSTLQTSTVYHSPFRVDSTSFLAVSGTDLRLVYTADFTYVSLTTVTAGAKMRYVRVGPIILFCNGYEKGKYENDAYSAWSAGTYYGPDTSRVFEAPPIGTILEYYAGRVWIAEGNVLWFSEPYFLNLFDKSRGFFYYESDITMISAVKHGLYVSTQDRVFFLEGRTPDEMNETTLTDYPSIKGTDVKVSGTILSDTHKQQNMVSLFTTTKGICIGGVTFDNLTQDKFDYPLASEGCATMIDNIYVVNLYK